MSTGSWFPLRGHRIVSPYRPSVPHRGAHFNWSIFGYAPRVLIVRARVCCEEFTWRTFRIFFIFAVRGRGKGRKRPIRWRGAVFLLKIEGGGGGLSEEEGAGGQLPRGCPQGGGGGGQNFFFFGAEMPAKI